MPPWPVGLEGGPGAGEAGFNRGLGFGQMTFADGIAIEGLDVAALVIGLGPGPQVVSDVFPRVAGLVIGAESAAGVIAAMDHAVFAARVAGDAVDHAVFGPVHLVQHFLVAGVVAIGDEVTGRFPALDVAGGDGPGGAGQLALAGEEFLIDRRAEDGEATAPFLDSGELLDGHGAGEEEVLRLAAQALA